MIKYSAEVEAAMNNKKPIVLIESAGTFEGLPYPTNVESSNAVEKVIRDNGAVPAYVAVINGVIKVGMTDEEKEDIGKKRGTLPKVSRRELPMVMAQKKDAVTSIAATMVVADRIQVPVVLGGGMGGVHRGAETTMDISSDLDEAAQRNVIVVCSGAKSIMDLPLTMEYLETKAVSVVGYQTDELPAYMARTSGVKVPFRVDDVKELAEAYKLKNELGISSGMLLLNPISEQYAVDADKMNEAIAFAIDKCNKDGVKGKETTKHIMMEVNRIMGGDSIEAQMAMVAENAVVAAKLANCL